MRGGWGGSRWHDATRTWCQKSSKGGGPTLRGVRGKAPWLLTERERLLPMFGEEKDERKMKRFFLF